MEATESDSSISFREIKRMVGDRVLPAYLDYDGLSQFSEEE
jgi:hypothetical protein